MTQTSVDQARSQMESQNVSISSAQIQVQIASLVQQKGHARFGYCHRIRASVQLIMLNRNAQLVMR
jgi:hypothetical protein